MAESVDALVSNTSGATRAGSTPALGTKKEAVPDKAQPLLFFRRTPGNARRPLAKDKSKRTLIFRDAHKSTYARGHF